MKTFLKLVGEFLPRYRKNFRKMGLADQVQTVVRDLGGHHQTKNKDTGWRTKRDRACIVHAAIRRLKIKNVLSISQKHIGQILHAWAREGIAAATFQTRLSHLRWFTSAIGKPGMVRSVSYYGLSDDLVRRTYVATTTKSWAGNGIDPQSMIEEIAKEHEYVACQLEGQQLFGLRTSESMQICPTEDRQGDMLVVSRGTKGGRTRVIPIETQAQYNWLGKAAELAALTNRGNLIEGDRSYKQARNHRNYVARKFGITKTELGVVPHGLRVQFAEERYELVTGAPAPTRGGGCVTGEEDRQGRVEVSRVLGHSRESIAGAYIGARPQNQHIG